MEKALAAEPHDAVTRSGWAALRRRAESASLFTAPATRQKRTSILSGRRAGSRNLEALSICSITTEAPVSGADGESATHGAQIAELSPAEVTGEGQAGEKRNEYSTAETHLRQPSEPRRNRSAS